VFELDACEHIGGGPERLEALHWPGQVLDRAMILFGDVVEVRNLVHGDPDSLAAVDLIYGGFVGTAFIHHDLFWRFVLTHCFFEEPPGSRDVTV
jgi:hypothetical protein